MCLLVIEILKKLAAGEWKGSVGDITELEVTIFKSSHDSKLIADKFMQTWSESIEQYVYVHEL